MILLLLGLAFASEPCDELKRDMKALEIFLQDEEDHKTYCPKLNWEHLTLKYIKKN